MFSRAPHREEIRAKSKEIFMGSSKGSSAASIPDPITPAVAKDAQIAESMTGAQQQERQLRRGIGSTYARYNSGAMQEADQNGVKKTLG
jgi:hypothetical protein